jgi:hypothetical protein
MGKGSKVEETAQEKAFADVARARVDDFQKRWAPVIQNFAGKVEQANAPGSFERKRIAGSAATDNAIAFTKAGQGLTDASAATGTIGASRQKLGIASMADDQATSGGLAQVAGDAAGDNTYVSWLQAVTALGRGQKATAVGGLAQEAALSGRQAQADADQSLQSAIGNASLIGKAAGGGLGLAMGKPNSPSAPNTDDYRGAFLPGSLRGGNSILPTPGG